ncbi:zinc-binding dehydrogenase [Alloactinosynnema sp. L-07]|uniref:zinc-binding dehydrogenase n=1 Tax=Alloactinosynnema sp. L-07 TaxID=1653480 RepID=UPI00350EA96A
MSSYSGQGGIAGAAVAMAAGIGATVVVTSSSREKIERSRELGARRCALFRARDGLRRPRCSRPEAEVFDVVLDSVGTWRESIEVLNRGGRLVVLGVSRVHRAASILGPYSLGTSVCSARGWAVSRISQAS